MQRIGLDRIDLPLGRQWAINSRVMPNTRPPINGTEIAIAGSSRSSPDKRTPGSS